MVLREIFLADLNDLLVKVYHDHLFHRVVPKHFTGGCALTTTGYEHLLRFGVGDHGWLYQTLVVDELIRLGRLGLPVQDKAAAKAPDFEYLDCLIFTFP